MPRDMPTLIEALKLVSVVAGAAILGNWFLAELKKAQRQNRPWYSVYFSPPGLLILAALLLPVLYWLARQ
jgi:hypothetical protein